MTNTFWKDKKVLITGHTGFKGTWLCLLLNRFGAKIYGYARGIPTNPGLFDLAKVGQLMTDTSWNDIREYDVLRTYIKKWQPAYVIHMAAQAIVKDGFAAPKSTFEINTMGTVNLLQACTDIPSILGMLVITTDKVYGDCPNLWGYRETDPIKAADPYSTSKAAAELVVSCWQKSFNPCWGRLNSARAGNVIGFGDWAHRVIPMTMEALIKGECPPIWDPNAVRPWQSVLDCLSGYLTLLEEQDNHPEGGWNFGPNYEEQETVGDVVDKICELWNGPKRKVSQCPDMYPLDITLKLDSYKSRQLLGWKPKWEIDRTLAELVRGYKDYNRGKDVRLICEDTIDSYFTEEPIDE